MRAAVRGVEERAFEVAAAQSREVGGLVVDEVAHEGNDRARDWLLMVVTGVAHGDGDV